MAGVNAQVIATPILRASTVGGGHFGHNKTEKAVSARAYLPGWVADVRLAIKNMFLANAISAVNPVAHYPCDL